MLTVALEIASEATGLMCAGFRAGVAVHKKDAIDLLTEYDLRVEDHIRRRLRAAFPEHAIVGEEGERQPLDGRPVWYVDPIDGTTNYAHGHPFFAVSIALWDNGEGRLGVVSAPALGVTWAAERGGGATRNGRPCRVSERAELSDALCATGFPYDRWTSDEDNLRELAAFLKRVRGVRRCGSAAIDLCLVADGTYDLYWEQKLNPWDLCAGAVIVEAAGGQLSGYAGERADPRSGRLVASNGLLHEAALEVLAATRRPVSTLGDA